MSTDKEAERIAAEPRYLTISMRWRNRDGGESYFSATNITKSEALKSAKRMGYPGHNGSVWNYLKDDFKSLGLRVRTILQKGETQ